MFSSAPILTRVKYTNCSLVLTDSFYDQISYVIILYESFCCDFYADSNKNVIVFLALLS